MYTENIQLINSYQKYYYIIIFLREYIIFLLNRLLRNRQIRCIDDEVIGHCLLGFERVQKDILCSSIIIESIDSSHQLLQLLSEN